MASSTLTPKYDNSSSYTFVLVSTSADGATFKVDGRDLATPFEVNVQRKLTTGNKTGNDHVVVRMARTERNATTAKLATAQVLVDISIPKDCSIITQAEQVKLLGAVSSLLNDNAALQATTVARTALVNGRDI